MQDHGETGDALERARAVRAQSFGAIETDYDRYRPRPPREALEWLLPPGCQAALDLGVGTGILTHQTTPEDLVGLVGTLSLVITLPQPEREELLGRVAGFIAARFQPADGGTISLPMACRCWRAVRL